MGGTGYTEFGVRVDLTDEAVLSLSVADEPGVAKRVSPFGAAPKLKPWAGGVLFATDAGLPACGWLPKSRVEKWAKVKGVDRRVLFAAGVAIAVNGFGSDAENV